MLGIDVHDCADGPQGEVPGRARSAEGYVLTVEPGLYFQPEDELVPEELRGIGVRIEDDVLVTATGSVNLSAGLPRRSDEVETWLAAQREAGPRLPELIQEYDHAAGPAAGVCDASRRYDAGGGARRCLRCSAPLLPARPGHAGRPDVRRMRAFFR